MIGLPTETQEDVEAILEDGIRIKKIGKSIHGNSVKVHLGIASLIPKPHTPFQWLPVESPESIQENLDFLKVGTRKAGIKMSYNIPDSTLLESWLSRGDRRLNQVIHEAWKNGAKFDAWGERDNLQIWRNAFAADIDPDFYAYRRANSMKCCPGTTSILALKRISQARFLMESARQNANGLPSELLYVRYFRQLW